MARKHSASHLIVYLILILLLSGCAAWSGPRASFDIENPPDGWYRVTEQLDHYDIWIPETWEMVTYQLAPDLGWVTYFSPLDDQSDDIIRVFLDAGDENDAQLCPIETKFCRPYKLSLDNTTVICEERLRIWRNVNYWYNNCFVAPTNMDIYDPEAMPDEIYIYFRFGTDKENHEENLQIFWMMIASFMQEQGITAQK